MGKVEKPIENGPSREDKYRTGRTTPREIDNSHLPPEPVEEQPVHNPTQTMERERQTRYHQAIAKWKNECNQIDRIGVLCGDKPWDTADRKAKSLIYLSLVIEGQKMHARKFPQTNVENKTTQEIWEELELTFIRPRNVTFDRYLLLTRKQQRGETMEQFHSALRSLTMSASPPGGRIFTRHTHSEHDRPWNTERT